jgi:opacity protein-like surface antigen
MMRGHRYVLGALLVSSLVTTPLSAQTGGPATPPPAITFRGLAFVGFQQFAASQTFTATMDSASGQFYGGGGGIELRSGFFVRVTASRFRKTGQRALDLDGQVFKLGIPLTVTIVPFEVTAGYRIKRFGRIVPYAGGGIGSYGYKEESKFAEASENVSDRFTGYHIAGGADVSLTRWLWVTGEVLFADVPNGLGKGGLSEQYGETNLGGTSLRLLVQVGR